MKKSELRNIIKEQIKNILFEDIKERSKKAGDALRKAGFTYYGVSAGENDASVVANSHWKGYKQKIEDTLDNAGIGKFSVRSAVRAGYFILIFESKFIKNVEEKLLKESFYRLPGHVIGNEFYSAFEKLQSIYDSQRNGNDFNIKEFNNVISQLQKIKKEAKQFNFEEEVPVFYQYKKK